MKKLFSFLFGLFLFFRFVVPSFAASNFATSFDVTYTVMPTGITHAVFNGSIQNTSDSFYPSSYTIKTGFQDVQHASASDSLGAITPTIKNSDNGSAITLPFNKKAIGAGSKVDFTFAFDTADVAVKSGNIWEINIPGIVSPGDYKTFTVHLKVPQSFGQPAYIKPATASQSLDFPKDILGTSGISLAFGNNQVYNFTLSYHLKNNVLFPTTQEIALPPTTNYQDVAISDLSPAPKNVRIDSDGNWLAQYDLLPSQKLDIVAKGNIFVNRTPKEEELTTEERKTLLQETSNWQVNNAQIKELAKELQTPKAIYDYVVSRLKYDFSRVAGNQQRLGAVNVLNNPDSAVCLEFTDLFVALSRAAGIPAREVDGFANTQNTQERPLSLVKDVLHAWPEYYDDASKTWIMVDPTWGNTTKGTDYFYTLDFDHVAFVKKGAKDDSPVPAGGYKVANQPQDKDVFVSAGDAALPDNPQAIVDFGVASQIFSNSVIQGQLMIKNAGEVLMPSQKVIITTNALQPHEQIVTTAAIPPYGSITQPVQFEKTSLLTNGTFPITMQVGGNTITKTIKVYPFFLQRNLIIGGIIFAILCIIISFIATKAWRLFIPRPKG